MFLYVPDVGEETSGSTARSKTATTVVKQTMNSKEPNEPIAVSNLVNRGVDSGDPLLRDFWSTKGSTSMSVHPSAQSAGKHPPSSNALMSRRVIHLTTPGCHLNSETTKLGNNHLLHASGVRWVLQILPNPSITTCQLLSVPRTVGSRTYYVNTFGYLPPSPMGTSIPSKSFKIRPSQIGSSSVHGSVTSSGTACSPVHPFRRHVFEDMSSSMLGEWPMEWPI